MARRIAVRRPRHPHLARRGLGAGVAAGARRRCTRRRRTTKRWRCSIACRSSRCRPPDVVSSSRTARSVCWRSGAPTKPALAVAAVVTTDPAYRPSEAEHASARARNLQGCSRPSCCRGIIIARYGEARAAYDGQQWAEAAKGFQQVSRSRRSRSPSARTRRRTGLQGAGGRVPEEARRRRGRREEGRRASCSSAGSRDAADRRRRSLAPVAPPAPDYTRVFDSIRHERWRRSARDDPSGHPEVE